MNTVNERLSDAAVDHAVDLAHYGNGVVHRMIALLNRSDADLARRLTDITSAMPPESFTVERLEGLLQSVRALNTQAFDAVGREMAGELRALVAYEAGYQARLFESVIPPQVVASVGVAQVEVSQVYAAAMARPFQGVLLREALGKIEASRATMIREQIRQGYVQQEPVQQIVRRIIGTKAKGYSDGLMDAPRRHVESIVRTAVSHTAGTVRDAFFERNTDLIKAIKWVSTLDSRTTLQWCVPRDGKMYTPDDHKPIGHAFKWLAGAGRLHWNCRSTSVPITKSWRDLGIDADELPPGARASMDGTVPADQTYAQWLRKQSAARQLDVMGGERFKRFRAGEPLGSFYNNRGRLLSLDELAARDAEMRKAA